MGIQNRSSGGETARTGTAKVGPSSHGRKASGGKDLRNEKEAARGRI